MLLYLSFPKNTFVCRLCEAHCSDAKAFKIAKDIDTTSQCALACAFKNNVNQYYTLFHMSGGFLDPFASSQLEAEKALKVKALLRKGGCGPPSNPGGQFIQKTAFVWEV